jgi:hypothetical protein
MGEKLTEASLRRALNLPENAPHAVVLAAIDVLNTRSAARLGLPLDTPPATLRAAERAVAAASAAQQRKSSVAAMLGHEPPAQQAQPTPQVEEYHPAAVPVSRSMANTHAMSWMYEEGNE